MPYRLSLINHTGCIMPSGHRQCAIDAFCIAKCFHVRDAMRAADEAHCGRRRRRRRL